jgi:hypothetical protein
MVRARRTAGGRLTGARWRRSTKGWQVIGYQGLALGCAILGGRAEVRVADGPWWAGFLLIALGFLVTCLRIVFPQDSPDKLAWWRDRRQSRRRSGTEDEQT